MSPEKLEIIRQRIWRPVHWLALVLVPVGMAIFVLYRSGHLDKATTTQILMTIFAVVYALYTLVDFVTLELRIRGYQLRFEERPVLFLVCYAAFVFLFIFCYWGSLGIDR